MHINYSEFSEMNESESRYFNKSLHDTGFAHDKNSHMNSKENKLYISVVLIVLLILISIFKTFPVLQITAVSQEVDYTLEVRGLTLKYVLISTASEIYDMNVRIKREQTLYYRSYDDRMYTHYEWIKKTYSQMNDEMKVCLDTLYKNGSNEGKFIYLLSGLQDEAGMNEIIHKIKVSRISPELKAAAEKFYPCFYEKSLKDYLRKNKNIYDQYIEEFNKNFQENNTDLLGFIEECSGISYDKKYKPILYYTMRLGNAWGFTYKNLYISLLPCTENEYKDLFYIPYHEYSHGIFQTITSTKEFKEVVKNLKNNSTMYNAWNNNYYNQYYTWEEWCEDNLVEGFAMYLDYKEKGKRINKRHSIRPYDKEYFYYLVQNNFDPENMELKDITLNFLKEITK